MDHLDDVPSPFVWLDADGGWNDLLSLVFAGAAWPEGSENAVWDLSQEWGTLADDLSAAAEGLQAAATDLLAAWDAPAAVGFDDLARTLLGSPDAGLPGHVRNAVAMAQQTSAFGVDLQYAKVSVNVAVAVAAMAVVLSFVLAAAGGLSLLTLGPIATVARQAVIRALETLTTAAGRRAAVEEVGRAVTDQAAAVAGRAAGASAGQHLSHEVVEEVLEELVVDVTTQGWQLSHGSRTDWDGLSTLQSAISGGVGGAVGAGAVAPAVARLRRTPRVTAVAGLGADGGRAARLGNAGIRHTGGLAATAGTNVVASPVGGVAASLLTGQGLPALDWSDLGAAALGVVGRYGTVSPTDPAVLTAAVHPVQTLAQLHVDALAGHTAQQAAEVARPGVPPSSPTPAGDVRTTRLAPVPGTGAATPSTSSPAHPAVDATAGRTAVPAVPDPSTPERIAAEPSAGHHGPSDQAPTGPVPSTGTTSPLVSGPSTSTPASSVQDVPPSTRSGLLGGPPVTSPDGLTASSAAAPAASPSSGPGQGSTTPVGPVREGTASAPASAPGPSGSTPPGAHAHDSLSAPSGDPPPTPVEPGAADPQPASEVPPPGRERVGPVAAQDASGDPASPAGTGGRPGGADGPHGPGDPTAPDQGPSGSGRQPVGPPASEQELLDGMPEPLRRYLVEAVAHGQVWADLVRHQLGDVVHHLVEQGLPAPEAVGLAHAVKGLASTARKIQPSIQGGSTFASAIWSMDDLVRFSLQIDPEHYGTSVLQALDTFRALGWSVPAVPGPGQTHDDWRNTWAIGNRHHGLLVVLTHAETGQRVELQFPTPQSWAVGKQTHALYEVMRFKRGDPYDRVVALGRILDIAAAEGVEDQFPGGVDKLGASKPNGPPQIFEKDRVLAAEFVSFAVERYGSTLDALLQANISASSAGRILDAIGRHAPMKPLEQEASRHDRSFTPGLDAVESSAGEAPSVLGEVPSDRSTPRPPDAPVPGAAGRPGGGTPRSSGSESGEGTRAGEGLRLPDRDLAEARDEADPGQSLGGRRGTGDDPVRRPEPHVDLGPDERQRDRAPGGRGPLRPAGAGHAGAGGGTGAGEGHDPADPGAPAGDVPHPGGPGAGHVGDLGGPGAAPRPAPLTGPLAVGSDAATALQHLLDRTDPPITWEGVDGVLPGRVVQLADGSTVRINTGPHPWARTDPDRPLQMWTVGSFHLDDGPLTPAASAFLGDLRTALDEPGAALPGPASHWLAQRATLDPTTHQITEHGVAAPVVVGARTLVWDAAQGWVDAGLAGGLARAVDDVLLPADLFADGPAAETVVGGAGHVLDLIDRTEQAEELTPLPGTPDHDAAVAVRGELRAELRRAAGHWVAHSAAQTMAEFVGGRAQVVAESNGRLLVRLDRGRLAVAVVAQAENDALGGSRPGLQQEGTTADIGQLRNELAASPGTTAWAWALTRQLQQGLVRHVRVQGVLASGEFVGMRVTEFEVRRPAHDQPGAPPADLEPYRYVDPGQVVREAMDRAMAGWTPSSVTDAIDNALRWLPHVNPLHGRFPVTDRVPWSNNCGDCSRAVADLVQGRDARAAFGDNGARAIDSHRWWGTGPGELREMWRWAHVTPGFRTGDGDPAAFTQHANTRIGEALAAQPEGTAAIVLVNWADELGAADRGHWFNAAVTEHGVEWIDGQTAEHSAWPPPYTRPYYGYSVITRAQGSDTWVDLFGEPDGADGGPSAPYVPGSIRQALAAGAAGATDRRPRR